MSVNEEKSLLSASWELGKATLKVGEEAIKDGSLQQAIENTATSLQQKALDALESTTKTTTETTPDIDAKDITPEKLKVAFTENGGVPGMAKLAESAGLNISEGAITAAYNAAASNQRFEEVYNQLFSQDSPETQTEQPGFLAILMGLLSGDTQGAMSAISSWFDGILNNIKGFPKAAQQKIGSVVGQIKTTALSVISPVVDKLAPMVAGIGAKFGFGEEADVQVANAETAPADNANNAESSVQTAKNNPGGGLDNANAQKPFHTASTDTNTQTQSPTPSHDINIPGNN